MKRNNIKRTGKKNTKPPKNIKYKMKKKWKK